MDIPDIEYAFHDAVIGKIDFVEPDRVRMLVDLYPIFYPDRPEVSVEFLGIRNSQKVRQYVESLHADDEDDGDNYLGCRINTMGYDTLRRSTRNSLFVYFETDWWGGVRISCTNLVVAQTQRGV